MIKRDRISLNDSMLDVMLKLAEGNPGAITVLTQIVKQDSTEGFFILLGLDDMNIRGSQIWVGYKDYCDCDLTKFIEAVTNRDGNMVAEINRAFSSDQPQAVTHGGSWL